MSRFRNIFHGFETITGIYFLSYEVRFCYEKRIILKNGKVVCLENATMFQIQDMSENGK